MSPFRRTLCSSSRFPCIRQPRRGVLHIETELALGKAHTREPTVRARSPNAKPRRTNCGIKAKHLYKQRTVRVACDAPSAPLGYCKTREECRKRNRPDETPALLSCGGRYLTDAAKC